MKVYVLIKFLVASLVGIALNIEDVYALLYSTFYFRTLSSKVPCATPTLASSRGYMKQTLTQPRKDIDSLNLEEYIIREFSRFSSESQTVQTDGQHLKPFLRHKERMENILSNFSSSSFAVDQLESFLGSRDRYELCFFASEEDDLESKDKININDRFWKLGMTHGKVSKVAKRKSDSCYAGDGIFVIEQSILEGASVTRYIYRRLSAAATSSLGNDHQGRSNTSGTRTIAAQAVTPVQCQQDMLLLAFEWRLFGRKVYSRTIGRRERWFVRLCSPNGLVFLDMEECGDGTTYEYAVCGDYKRSAAFCKASFG